MLGRSSLLKASGAALPLFREDATDYISRVEAADGQALEDAVRTAINAFFQGCADDASPNAGVSNLAALRASCLLAGPRTRQGCAVPLLSSMPTPILLNFGSADYNRKTGLLAGVIPANGQIKAINSQRNNTADPQNNCSFSVFVTSVGATTSATKVMLGSQIAGTNQKIIACSTAINSGAVSFRCQDVGSLAAGVGARVPGLIGASRTAAANYSIRNNGLSATITSSSVVPSSQNIFICSTTDNGTTPIFVDDSIYSFYHIGEAVNLAGLDTRVSAYMTALATAIP